MKYILTLLLFIGITCFAQGQKNYQDGLVITINHEILEGKLSNVHKNSHNYIDFLFPGGKDTTFTPHHILSYEIGNQKFVVVPVPHPTRNDTTYLFAQVMVEGYANLYKTRIKTDFITPAEDAYLCKKFDEKTFYPSGKLSSISKFLSDYPIMENELKSNPHAYLNNLETKLLFFNNYNTWKKRQIDSLSAIQRNQALIPSSRFRLEVLMNDTLELTASSKTELDKITFKIDQNPSLNIFFEFVQVSPNQIQTRRVMKAVMNYLGKLAGRINTKVVSVAESQVALPSKEGAQIIYYYFK